MKRNLALLMALALTACATQTPYRPAESKRDYGYREQQLEANRYRVMFSGNSSTDQYVTKDYALLRAGELTLQKGYDWFQLARHNTDKDTDYTAIDSGFYAPPTTSVYQRCGAVSCRTVVYQDPGFGYGGGFGTVTSTNKYSSEVEIVMGKDPMPKSVDAYNARELVSTLRQRLQTGG